MEIAGVDAGPTAHYPVTELVEEVAKTDRSYAFASTRATAAMAFGIGASGRSGCRLIRAAP